PIMQVLEFRLALASPGFFIDIKTREELDGDEARAIPSLNKIEFREDVYERAWHGSGRDRFTAAHELGHFLMHRNLGLSPPEQSEGFPIYRESEWQADTFAGGLLMSVRHARRFTDEYDFAEAAQVTYAAAEVTWAKYRKEGIVR